MRIVLGCSLEPGAVGYIWVCVEKQTCVLARLAFCVRRPAETLRLVGARTGGGEFMTGGGALLFCRNGRTGLFFGLFCAGVALMLSGYNECAERMASRDGWRRCGCIGCAFSVGRRNVACAPRRGCKRYRPLCSCRSQGYLRTVTVGRGGGWAGAAVAQAPDSLLALRLSASCRCLTLVVVNRR